jgi:predicted SnoaL-like aldol condensation-catalyzing enzyme
LADDFVSHLKRSIDDGKGDLKRAIDRLSTVLADVSLTVEAVIAEGDRVAVRVTVGATQVGQFMGLPPRRRSYSIGEIRIFRVRDGKVTEHWHQYDQPGMMRQLEGGPRCIARVELLLPDQVRGRPAYSPTRRESSMAEPRTLLDGLIRSPPVGPSGRERARGRHRMSGTGRMWLLRRSARTVCPGMQIPARRRP